MKKKLMRVRRQNPLAQKILLTMRLTLFLMVLSVFTAYSSSYAQKTKLSLNAKNMQVKEVLNEIENQSEFFFMYDNKQVDVERKVSLEASSVNIDQVLQKLFEGTSVNYKVVNRQILLFTESNLGTSTQQQKSVSGKVTDSSGSPLPGVSVVVKGTTTGVITDADGNYSLPKVPENATLQFSFVGMKAQEVAVGGKATINVKMEDETVGIEEVVAVGYGTINKQSLTGAVSKADIDAFSNIPSNNILELIKGSVTGVAISGTNKAGEIGSIDIRGQNSLAATNMPLIVLDGAVFNGSLADIPSMDIENMTFLKDASAAAVYGSRSSNGVVLIETKKGTGVKGKPEFDLKLNYGISHQLKPLEVYDSNRYIQRLLDIRTINGQEADPNKIAIYLTDEEQKNYNATPDHQPTITDAFSLFNQLGQTLNSTISISNKTEKTRYYLSSTLIKQSGIIINDDYKQIAGRVNIDSDITKWFNLGIKSSYSFRDYSGSTIYGGVGDGSSIYSFSPYASVYNEDGTYKRYPQSITSFNNPFLQLATADLEKYNNLNGLVTALIKIPWVDGLTYNLNFSNQLEWSERNWFYDKQTVRGSSKNSLGQRGYNSNYHLLLDNMLKYQKLFNERHFVDITLLYSREGNTWNSLTGYAENFDNPVLVDYKLENGKTQTVDTGGGESNAIGIMARGNYTYNGKYSITATIRRDGYSGFSKNNKWGTFPSLGINWNITKENFLSNVKNLNNLTLRASYGTNGNQSISPYSTLARISTDKYIYAGDGSYSLTQYISNMANNDLGWESTTGFNLGSDFSIFNNKLNGAVDIYKTRTNNLLFNLPLPGITGQSSVLSNVGEIMNRGIEINLNGTVIQRSNLKWTSNFAFSLNRNSIKSILGKDSNGDGKEDDLISSGYFIGKSLGTIYDYRVIGMWAQQDKDNGSIMQGMRPGDYKLEDLNNDGKISSDKDRQFIGTTQENFRWGWTNNLEYKNFSFMLYFYSVWGGNGYYLSKTNTPHLDGYVESSSMNHPIYDYWTSVNANAEFPRLDYSKAAYKGKKFYDRSFIKLQKISIEYNITSLVKSMGINKLTISASGDNLLTFAPYWLGLDPETNSGLSDSSIPSMRTYMLSLNLNF